MHSHSITYAKVVLDSWLPVSKDNKNYPSRLAATATRRSYLGSALPCLFIQSQLPLEAIAGEEEAKERANERAISNQKRGRQAELICSCHHRMGEQENNKSPSGGNNMAVEAPAKENGRAADPRLQGISDAIRVVPHFPKPGIMFNDITEVLLRPGVFKDAVDMFVERYRGMSIAAVAGIEARGFIFGPAIALAIGAKFIPLRKPKKLPGEVISETYVLEYGTDCLEMHVGAIESGERVVVVDDLVATGGTLSAAIRLLERAGADVVECACLIGLPKFKDFYKLNGKPVYVLVESRK